MHVTCQILLARRSIREKRAVPSHIGPTFDCYASDFLKILSYLRANHWQLVAAHQIRSSAAIHHPNAVIYRLKTSKLPIISTFCIFFMQTP